MLSLSSYLPSFLLLLLQVTGDSPEGVGINFGKWEAMEAEDGLGAGHAHVYLTHSGSVPARSSRWENYGSSV